MNKHLKQISKQLMVFALIASIFNVYALEVWCSISMAPGHHQGKGSGLVHSESPVDHHHEGLAANHDQKGHVALINSELQKHEDKCPHQGSSKEKEDCCDQTNFFYASGSGLQKFQFAPDDFQFIVPDHLTFTGSHANSHADLPVNLFPDVGLKPKIPDIRIFICSLII
ncbi:hypothetical protein F0P94_07220 [Adhaeribacter soli]|uniref:Uncharacterized protein n=2 Tax=Adhaeribacter soli TaxID=2607655 RepID=A0A5N1J0R6_9BACT|nr:hypothetical protein F0P94_07220 [Adhaeribacter soli]